MLTQMFVTPMEGRIGRRNDQVQAGVDESETGKWENGQIAHGLGRSYVRHAHSEMHEQKVAHKTSRFETWQPEVSPVIYYSSRCLWNHFTDGRLALHRRNALEVVSSRIAVPMHAAKPRVR